MEMAAMLTTTIRKVSANTYTWKVLDAGAHVGNGTTLSWKAASKQSAKARSDYRARVARGAAALAKFKEPLRNNNRVFVYGRRKRRRR